jgi:HTH-type transcriptional regulator/antitoxin HigA
MTEHGIFVRAIVTEADHDWAILRILQLTDAIPAEGSPEDHELAALATLVDHYEQERFPMRSGSAVACIKFMLEQKGLSRKALEPMIGSRARVSEVLSGKRALTLSMIRKLHAGLGIPAEILLEQHKSSVKPPASKTGATRRKAA